MSRRISVILVAAGLAASAATAANAAITVLGGGLARTCYHAAEFGGDPKDGIAACSYALDEQALAKHDRAATFINRGILYSRAEATEEAIADYDHGLDIDASLGEGYVDRGAALIVQKRYDDALDDINKGIALDTKEPQIAYYDLAVAQEALGNIRAAYEDYKKAIQIEPGFALANAQLSRFKIVRRTSDGT